MASTWTTLLPKGSTKIRLSPPIFQDRWTNIQEGEVPCKKWQLAVRGGNPATISGSGMIFTKTGGSGNIELFYKDDTSHTTRITRSGSGSDVGIGTFDQRLYGSPIIMSSSTEFENTQDGFCVAWGFIAANGNLAQGYNIATSSKTSTGFYTVEFSGNVFSGGDVYITVATPIADGVTHNRSVMVREQTGSEIFFSTVTVDDDSPNVDCAFMFAVFGGRT